MQKEVFLRQDVVPEPLFNQWYAWPYLIPPYTGALYVANSHLKIMQSFVSSPQIHIAALKNPEMLGGPFINYGADKVGEVRQLIEKTQRENPALLELAEAIKTLDTLLASECTGYSMEQLYARVPDALRGYVELVYDLRDNPSIRFIEGLLYKSKFYDDRPQKILLSRLDCDNRSFVFSTPRLQADGAVMLDLGYAREEIDELLSMKYAARPYDAIARLLDISPEDEKTFASFFTEEPPVRQPPFTGEGVRIRYFGHACLLIESKDVSILTDPVVSYDRDGGMSRYTWADLPETIDYVLLTHTHQDHVMLESLLQLRRNVRNFIVPRSSGCDRMDPSLRLILKTVGFENVWEIEEMEQVSIPGGVITGLPFLGEHCDLNVRTKLAFHVELLGNTFVMAADSNNLENRLYEHLHDALGDIDALFIGMECVGAPMSWLYGPMMMRPATRKNDQSRRLDGSDFEKGIRIVDVLKPKEVYVYAMGQEPWCSFLTSIHYTDESPPIVESTKLVDECRRRGLVAERLYGCKEFFRPERQTSRGSARAVATLGRG